MQIVQRVAVCQRFGADREQEALLPNNSQIWYQWKSVPVRPSVSSIVSAAALFNPVLSCVAAFFFLFKHWHLKMMVLSHFCQKRLVWYWTGTWCNTKMFLFGCYLSNPVSFLPSPIQLIAECELVKTERETELINEQVLIAMSEMGLDRECAIQVRQNPN